MITYVPLFKQSSNQKYQQTEERPTFAPTYKINKPWSLHFDYWSDISIAG